MVGASRTRTLYDRGLFPKTGSEPKFGCGSPNQAPRETFSHMLDALSKRGPTFFHDNYACHHWLHGKPPLAPIIVCRRPSCKSARWVENATWQPRCYLQPENPSSRRWDGFRRGDRCSLYARREQLLLINARYAVYARSIIALYYLLCTQHHNASKSSHKPVVRCLPPPTEGFPSVGRG